MSYFGESQALPLSTDNQPSIVETNLLWNGKKYCLRYLTMDASGTEHHLKQIIEFGLKFLKEGRPTSTNSEISKNKFNQYDYSNTDVTAESDYKTTKGKELITNEKFDSNTFSTPALEDRLKVDNENMLRKIEENEIRKDIINIIFVSSKPNSRSDQNNDEVVFPTEENLEYDEFTQIPTGVNIFDRANVPAALVASLLG
ncbi:hypothetical protein EVAR_49314_1 [Eumeta japonica]|uniref:Uncharacterized protein n=1 Tax=Eumeta variegata TaxID=151549 RepID=A0A4C1Y7A3_EUMVA|nr:hypothetical protein EVAR_49314_1 [Eumeta japonica]